jgi:hypothetical protein
MGCVALRLQKEKPNSALLSFFCSYLPLSQNTSNKSKTAAGPCTYRGKMNAIQSRTRFTQLLENAEADDKWLTLRSAKLKQT